MDMVVNTDYIPAPSETILYGLLKKIDFITPNETEASMLVGITVKDEKDAEKATSIIRGMGVKNVVITIGAQGALICSDDGNEMVPVRKIKPVGTTAAGDVFKGAMAVVLSEGKGLKDAVVFATCAAAISVTRRGAQSPVPYRR